MNRMSTIFQDCYSESTVNIYILLRSNGKLITFKYNIFVIA